MAIHRLAEYAVRPEEREAVEEAVRAFLEAVALNEPETRYRAFRREPGLGYVHVMTFPDEAAERAHREASYTRRFADAVYPRCTQSPTFTKLVPISP